MGVKVLARPLRPGAEQGFGKLVWKLLFDCEFFLKFLRTTI